MDRTHPDSGDYITPPMTLRDYFAGQAIAGAVGRLPLEIMKDCTEAAYAWADAMLKAREVKP